MNKINLVSVLLIANSFVLIGSIMNQNKTKDLENIQKNSTTTNPAELVTWISLLSQFILLLIKIKLEIV